MSKDSIHFFLNRESLLDVFLECEKDATFHYIKIGPRDESAKDDYSSIVEIPNLGISPHGTSPLDPRYLLLPKESVAVSREIKLNSSGSVYVIDQLQNPDSLVVSFGGRHSPTEQVAGSVTTAKGGPFSYGLLKKILVEVRKMSTLKKSFWVDTSSLQEAKNGTRLTTDVRGPKEYDLALT